MASNIGGNSLKTDDVAEKQDQSLAAGVENQRPAARHQDRTGSVTVLQDWRSVTGLWNWGLRSQGNRRMLTNNYR